MQLRKAKELCFNCDEKFTPSHRCLTYRVLLLQRDTESLDELSPAQADYLLELEGQPNK